MRFLLVLVFFISISSNAADTTKLYNPRANVTRDVEQALSKAKKGKEECSAANRRQLVCLVLSTE